MFAVAVLIISRVENEVSKTFSSFIPSETEPAWVADHTFCIDPFTPGLVESVAFHSCSTVSRVP